MAQTNETSGVQELIDKLKNQGVDAGQQKASEIVAAAQREASEIVAKAKQEAEKTHADAYRKIEQEKKAAQEAIQMAFRDTELALRSQFRSSFSAYLKKFVSLEMQDKDFVKQLALAVAGLQAEGVSHAKQATISVPAHLFQKGESGPLTQEGKDQLRHLILGLSSQMLREGIEFTTSDIKGGVHVRLAGEDIVVDVTDEAISELLLKYTMPRFRAIITGQN